MKKILIKTIELYQKTISPDHGWFKHTHLTGYCKFSPSCSEYAKLAIIKHGSFRGMSLGFWRVLRCNPWNKGGADPV